MSAKAQYVEEHHVSRSVKVSYEVRPGYSMGLHASLDPVCDTVNVYHCGEGSNCSNMHFRNPEEAMQFALWFVEAMRSTINKINEQGIHEHR